MSKALLVLLFVIASVFAQTIERDVHDHYQKSQTQDIIVFMKDFVDLNTLVVKGKSIDEYDVDTRAQLIVDQLMQKAKESQKELIAELDSKKFEYVVMWNVNGLLIKQVPLEFITSFLAKNNKIQSISINKKVEVEAIENDSIVEEPVDKYKDVKQDVIEFNVEWVKATAVWKMGHQGEKMIVGVGDTGLNHLHEAIVNSYNGTIAPGKFDHNYNWYDPTGRLKVPADGHGHGTHCSGTVAGGNGVNRKIGVAPKAKLIHCFALVNIAAQILCMQYWLAPTDVEGKNPVVAKRPHVVSHSYNNWSCAPGCSPQYERATQACIAAGIMVVNSSGNRGPACSSINPNSRFPDQTSVGSIGKNTDVISRFSSRGPNPGNANILKPQVVAPGEAVVSATGRSNNGYTAMSGTSMSTPNVAGGVALLWSAVPKLVRNIKLTNEILGSTAKGQKSDVCAPKGSPNGEYGYGTVDYLKAVQKAREMFQ